MMKRAPPLCDALRTLRKAGTSKLHEGFVLSNVGEASLATGRPRDAVAEFEEAFRLLGDDATPLREAARFGLARALWESAETRPRALALAREAAAAYDHLHIPDEAAKVRSLVDGPRTFGPAQDGEPALTTRARYSVQLARARGASSAGPTTIWRALAQNTRSSLDTAGSVHGSGWNRSVTSGRTTSRASPALRSIQATACPSRRQVGGATMNALPSFVRTRRPST